jgi:D-alanine-D-alanine ligase
VGVVGNLVGPVARRLPENDEAPRVQAGLRFFSPMEVDLKPFEGSDVIYTNRLKVELADKLHYICPAPLDIDMIDELNWLTAAVFRVTGALDVSRVDFRLDMNDDWKPYILRSTPPGLSPAFRIVIEANAKASATGLQHDPECGAQTLRDARLIASNQLSYPPASVRQREDFFISSKKGCLP